MIKSFVCSLTLLSFLALSARANLAEIIPGQLENAAGEAVDRSSLEGKLIGVYFSAQWCPPCRGFTPSLVNFHNKNKDAFEVVFVSSDRSPEDQRKYMADYKMDFVTVPHRSDVARSLAERYSVRGIPKLVILDSAGNVITENGRGELSANPAGALAAWQAKAGSE